MNLAFLALLPAALLIDRLFGELPSRVHPVCMMGALASRIEALFRRGSNNALMSLSGTLACLLVVLPCAALAGGLAWAAQVYADPRAAWFVSAIIIWICVAPRSLDEHALRVAVPLAKGDLEGARKAVSMMVGRNPDRLDAHGVARACVESVGENLTDGVLSTLFWAGIGLFFFGYPGAACLAVLHRSANVLDALWGKKNEKYIRFGTFAARLDDALNFVPARLSLPCIAFASRIIPNLRHNDILPVGWKYRAAHESPNSAWSEAAFAGALGLRLGGPVSYKGIPANYHWIGTGRTKASASDLALAIRLMWTTAVTGTLAFTLLLLFTPRLWTS